MSGGVQGQVAGQGEDNRQPEMRRIDTLALEIQKMAFTASTGLTDTINIYEAELLMEVQKSRSHFLEYKEKVQKALGETEKQYDEQQKKVYVELGQLKKLYSQLGRHSKSSTTECNQIPEILMKKNEDMRNEIVNLSN